AQSRAAGIPQTGCRTSTETDGRTRSDGGRRQGGDVQLSAPRQRAVDHVDGVLQAVNRDERAEARPFLLAEQHLIEQIEPVERDARLAVFRLLLRVEERF